jgi:HSP20 family protein
VWSELNRLQGEMDRLFGRWARAPRQAGGTTYPALNVWEEADAFHVEADLPGVKQEDLEVFVRQRTELTVRGERKLDERKGAWHRRERGFGKFERVLELPAPVDADRVEAKLAGGVLFVTLPKADEAKPRRIEVKA